jgi:glycosyltransferase involved in cell wall biosynthesis
VPGTILTLGYNTGFLALWLRLRRRANFINMDGIEWKRAKYSLPARAYLWITERMAANSGADLIADHPVIEQRLRKIAPRARVTMIPYGGDRLDSGDPAILARLGLASGGYFTLIARPEAENSILEIVEAFSAEDSGAKLVVLGRYDPAVPYQARVLAAAGPDVIFPGAIYDKDVLRALRTHCIAYVHGHQVGGTNPSLVEAMAAGNAVIAHDNAFTRWVAGDGALYFADRDQFRQAVRHLMGDASVRQAMQAASVDRWRQDFAWPNILGAYQRLLSQSPVKAARGDWSGMDRSRQT